MPTPANPINVNSLGAVSFTGTDFVAGTLSIANGGTNATSYTQSNGIITYNGTSLVNYAGPQIDSSGRTTNTSQPAFLAEVSTTISNVTGDGTAYTVVFDTVVFDQTSSYNNSTGVFTAPVAGIYEVIGSVSGTNGSTGTTSVMGIVTPLATFIPNSLPVAALGGTNFYYLSGSLLVQLSVGQTVSLQYTVNGAIKDADIVGNLSSITNYFSVTLVC